MTISRIPPLPIVLLALICCLLPASAGAATIEANVSPFTGDPLSARVSIDDTIDPGHLVITIDVAGPNIGDLRGFFAHVSDESLLDGLSVAGVAVTSSAFDANRITRIGGGNNLNGGGTPCPCDLGIEFGSPGMGSNDIQSITFTLSHITEGLDISLFAGQAIGVRATSVGPLGGQREGSSKLTETLPVPEPSSALMMLLGLVGLASVGPQVRA